MKLIRELTEEVEYISEAKEDGTKNLFIEGIFMQSAIKNRNGRIYPEEVMDKEAARYIKEQVDTGRAFGELGHPQNPQINLDRVSHRIVSLKKEGTNYVGKALIGNTPFGNTTKGLIEMGGKIGVSSRALGTVKPNKQGINEVQGDLKICTAGDIVADPSAPDAWMSSIMEDVEWVYDDKNGWEALKIVELVKEEAKRNWKSLNETFKYKAFVSYIEKLSKN